MSIRSVYFLVLLLGFTFSSVGAVPIGSLQSYDDLSGAPDSAHIGQTVTIYGEVSIPDNILDPELYFVRDLTGGIMVHSSNAPNGGGKYLLQVTGVVTVNAGEVFLEESSVLGMVNGPTLVRPVEAAVDTIVADFSFVGSLLRAQGVAANCDSSGFDLIGNGQSLRVEPAAFTSVSTGVVQDDDLVAVTGPIRVTDGQLRIVPRDSVDLRVAPPVRPYLLTADGSGSFPDLAAAFAYSVVGDTISLAAGTYPAHSLLMMPGITLRSSNGVADSVVIDAEGLGNAFRFINGPASILRNLTMSGGQAGYGGAILFNTDFNKKSTIVDCVFEGNTAEYGGAVYSVYASPVFDSCVFRSNTANRGGGVDLEVVSYKNQFSDVINPDKTLSEPSFNRCEFQGNTAAIGGAFALNGFDAFVVFDSCDFVDNTATMRGGVGYLSGGTSPRLESCLISGNKAYDAGDVIYYYDAGAHGPSLMLNCTIVNNGTEGSSLLAGGEAGVAITNSIIAFNVSSVVLAQGHPDFAISCSNVYGNLAGDWLGLLAGFAAADSNFSANPLFCDLAGGDIALAANSPCLPGNHPDGYACGLVGAEGDNICAAVNDQVATVALSPTGDSLIQPNDLLDLNVFLRDASESLTMETGMRPTLTGAMGLGTVEALRLQPDYSWTSSFQAGFAVGEDTLVACDPEAQVVSCDTLFVRVTRDAIINSVLDIPNDQGRQVRIRWRSDTRDTLASEEPIVQYVVWREVADTKLLNKRVVLRPEELTAEFWTEPAPDWVLGMAETLWEPVGPAIPGMMWTEYTSVVPTLADSTAAGLVNSTFFVSAHTAQPQVFYSSLPRSGYSVDNIAPATPVNVVVNFDAGVVGFNWAPNHDEDFHSFRVYRDSTDIFEPSAENFVAATSEPSWSVAGGSGYYHRVTAIDHAGNESLSVLADGVTAVSKMLPSHWRLHPNVPNPFNPSTTIAFEIPRAGAVDLQIFDLRGRLVRTVLNRQQLASGRHAYTWAGKDDKQAPVASGVYLIRIRSGAWLATSRMTLAK